MYIFVSDSITQFPDALNARKMKLGVHSPRISPLISLLFAATAFRWNSSRLQDQRQFECNNWSILITSYVPIEWFTTYYNSSMIAGSIFILGRSINQNIKIIIKTSKKVVRFFAVSNNRAVYIIAINIRRQILW